MRFSSSDDTLISAIRNKDWALSIEIINERIDNVFSTVFDSETYMETELTEFLAIHRAIPVINHVIDIALIGSKNVDTVITNHTFLCLAIECKLFSVADRLIEIGADINEDTVKKKFRTWCKKGEEAKVVYSLSKGMTLGDFPAYTFDNKKPLHDAVEGGDERIIMLLLDYGADPKAPDSKGVTPYDLAVSMNLTAAFRFIQSHTSNDKTGLRLK